MSNRARGKIMTTHGVTLGNCHVCRAVGVAEAVDARVIVLLQVGKALLLERQEKR